jgi:sec-independent protein translocase protein TatA
MFGIGVPELIIILVIIVVFFGAGKLPDIGTSAGKAIKGFKTVRRWRPRYLIGKDAGKVIDLMDALRRSLIGKGGGQKERVERFLECKNGKAVAKARPKTLRHRSIPQRAVGAIQRQAGEGGTVKPLLCREGTAFPPRSIRTEGHGYMNRAVRSVCRVVWKGEGCESFPYLDYPILILCWMVALLLKHW